MNLPETLLASLTRICLCSLCTGKNVSSTDSCKPHPQVSSQEILKIQKLTGQNLKLLQGEKPGRRQAQGIGINLPMPI